MRWIRHDRAEAARSAKAQESSAAVQNALRTVQVETNLALHQQEAAMLLAAVTIRWSRSTSANTALRVTLP